MATSPAELFASIVWATTHYPMATAFAAIVGSTVVLVSLMYVLLRLTSSGGSSSMKPIMPSMPPANARYRTTKVFTRATVPKGLLSAHTTAKNVWGRIVVLEGELRYKIYDSEFHSGQKGVLAGPCLLA